MDYTGVVIQRGREQAEAQGDKRVIHGVAREDQLDPFGRRSSHRDVKTKSISQSAMGANRSWAMNLGGEPDLSKPYAQHPWIYACVSAISRASSSVPARIQRKLPNGEFETLPNSQLSILLETPNPLQSQRKFFRNICTSQMLYGETFLILLKRGPSGHMVPVEAIGGSLGMTAEIEPPEEIWPVRGDLVEPVLDEDSKLPIAWRFQTGGGYSTYPAHAVVQVAEVNPYNPLRGMGPMTAAYRTAAKDFVIDRYDEALLQNGGSPGGVLTVDGPLTDADQRAIKESWHEAHGRPESSRKTAVLPQGTEYKEIGLSPAQMEHEKLRSWDRQTILSIFGVPPVMLGLETMNYATSREQNRIFWETTVLPYLDFLKDEIQYKLIKRMRGEESAYLIDFDISGVSALREDMDSKVDRALKLYEKGHRSFVEAATLAGWNIDEVSVDGGDDRYVPVNLAPADQVGLPLQEQGDEDDDADLEEEERAIFEYITKDEELDEVYSKWRDTVNMSASELRAWAKTDCSKRASLSRAPINRNLTLLETKKADWTKAHMKSANRTISFVSRMKGMPKGKPVVQGCPSKRDISLRNWAFNPDKGKSMPSLPEWLDSEEKQEFFFKSLTVREEEAIDKLMPKLDRVIKDFLLAQRKKLREIAAEAPNSKSQAVTKYVPTKSEIRRLLDINEEYWADQLSTAMLPTLKNMMVVGAAGAAAEIGAAPFISSVTDPEVLSFYSKFPAWLKERSVNTLHKDITNVILRELSRTQGVGSVASIQEAVRLALVDLEDQVKVMIDKIPTRSQMIARTEVQKAQNGARVAEWKKQGVQRHQWVTSNDAAVRVSHQFIQGEIARVGEPFSIGVAYPGAPGGDAREVVNCRCRTIPIANQ
jgi:HK97 family phage portal protein